MIEYGWANGLAQVQPPSPHDSDSNYAVLAPPLPLPRSPATTLSHTLLARQAGPEQIYREYVEAQLRAAADSDGGSGEAGGDERWEA